MALLQRLLGVEGGRAPEVGGVADLDVIVLDEDVDGRGGLAGDEETVPAGVLEVRAEVAATVRVAPGVVLRRLGDHLEADAEEGCAGEEAGEEAEDVIGAEGVGAGRDAVEEEAGAEAVAAEEVAVEAFRQVFGLDVVGADADVEDPAVEGLLCRGHAVNYSLRRGLESGAARC